MEFASKVTRKSKRIADWVDRSEGSVMDITVNGIKRRIRHRNHLRASARLARKLVRLSAGPFDSGCGEPGTGDVAGYGFPGVG